MSKNIIIGHGGLSTLLNVKEYIESSVYDKKDLFYRDDIVKYTDKPKKSKIQNCKPISEEHYLLATKKICPNCKESNNIKRGKKDKSHNYKRLWRCCACHTDFYI